ncbi:apolipoprotein N-acyltransferase [Flammeovirga kamogawensis]|uniref:Apolipoprotein N-acyltransferase n=1 Tax=Flammeovirga kamogawensis TaxID=373891 RepID=A0ABX8GQW4_9BACT|nr:apolipoprotein N-acyltransferase [Flammeovirga kamogawensis]MBB6462090.1 apolipoprotein N-acyltransferase [Flammeovirga kamogawensis]QWG05824.1 apolipoprotein N-acyltransferase [Flammeovirga kamogawensis]TRX67650.1 apolipoprotein N-acyltransferase [Flammeovirga kamogawensis]
MRKFLYDFIVANSEKKWYPWVLALLSGVLLGVSWHGLFPLVFIGLVPLLEIERVIAKSDQRFKGWKVYGFAFLALFTFNFIAYWWLWYASSWTTLSAWGANAALMALPFLAFHHTRRISNGKYFHLDFVCWWIAFEYLHLYWDFSWPWLNLGNVLSFTPSLAQWYEYTGTFGGTLWILLLNVYFFSFMVSGRKIVSIFFLSTIPVCVSLFMYYNHEDVGTPIEVMVVQPNINCYTEKFRYNARTGEQNTQTYINPDEQVRRMMALSEKAITPSTKFIFWPETSISKSIDEKYPDRSTDIISIRKFMQKYPNTTLISGADTYKIYGDSAQSETARSSKNIGYYDMFNTALRVHGNDPVTFYNKSQLVIGVEAIPFPMILKPIILNFGGSSGGLGRQEERAVFYNDTVAVAPIICYESVYGEYVTDYVKKGADFLTVITNDGWWDTTPGHKQHLAFSSLRAIETRKSVARSANTGISCFINQRGDILQPIAYGEMGAEVGKVFINKENTFYTLYGDYIARVAAVLAVTMLAVGITRKKALQI